MKNVYLLIFIFIATATVWGSDKSSLSKYDVEWFSQSRNASESMPFGGGDIGCNTWLLIIYDPISRRFVNNEKANALLKPIYRSPWKFPEV